VIADVAASAGDAAVRVRVKYNRQAILRRRPLLKYAL
jgi:hypothetical protein